MDSSQTQISKTMAYLLRHDPEGMEMDEEGFVRVEDLLKRLRNRRLRVDGEDVEEIVCRDPKGRYEMRGDRIRALYGHSIDVDPSLPDRNLPDALYHGTKRQSAEKILREGIHSGGRRKVHLSTTVEGARQVGRRHSSNPVVLRIDCATARRGGASIERASEAVCVADAIPPQAVERLEQPNSQG